MAKQVFISSNTIQLTAEEAYPSFAGKGITFVVLDDINYHHSFYYVEYKDGDNYTTHRFTNNEIFGNTFTWTDTRAVPDTTSLRFYIVSGPRTVYTTEYLELEKPHDPYEKALVRSGIPSAIASTSEEAATIYSQYDLVVFAEGYEDPTEAHYAGTQEVISLINEDTRVAGRVTVGSATIASIEAKIDNWKTVGAISILLDEFAVVRADQNTLIDYIHDAGMFVLANNPNYDDIFAKDNNNITSKLTYGDYYVFENAFYNGSLDIQSPANVNKMYQFWHTTNVWGKTYPEYYHVKTLQIDELPEIITADLSKKYQAFSLVGASVFHNSAVAICAFDDSIVDWDYSAIDFYSKDVPEVEVKSKTVGSTTFNYSWSAEINGNLHEVTFNAAGPDDRTYAEATHYMKYNDRHMVDVWASVYDHEKRIQDLEAGGESTQVQADYAETDPTKVSYIKNKPTIGDATITITQAGVTKGTFTVNTTVSSTIALDMSTQEQANWTESSTTSPAYIKNKPSLAAVAISGSYTDLTNKPSIPTVNDPAIIITQGGVTKGRFTLNQSTTDTIEVDVPIEQVQSDWNESTTTSKAYIKNKPSIPAAQIQSDWAQSTTTEVDYIKNKPTIPTVNDPTVTIMQGSVTKGSFSLNQASTTTITVDAPVEQVQANWNESTTTSKAYIQNKPTIPTVYDSTITIKQGSVTKGSFTLNQATPSTITLDMSTAQEQADWAESSTTAPSYIKNKPTIPSTADCEKIANKSTSWSATPDNTHYPSEKLVKDSLDAKGDLTIQWHETVTDAYYPSEKLVKNELDAKGTKISTWGTTPTNNQYPGAYLVKTSLDNKVDKSSTSTQAISCSGSSVPVRFYGSSTNDANYIGIAGPAGNYGGYYGVSTSKVPLYGNGTTVTEISLKGHTHDDYVKYTTTDSQQVIATSSTQSNSALGIKSGASTSESYILYIGSDGSSLGYIGMAGTTPTYVSSTGVSTAISLEGHTHDAYVKYSDTATQVITSTSSNTPIVVKSSTNHAYIGFQNSSGTTLGSIGVNAGNNLIYHNGSTAKYVSMSDHTHDTYVKYSSSGPQTITDTFTKVPLMLQSGTTDSAWLRFNNNAGTQLGLIGVNSNGIPIYSATGTTVVKEISLEGHNHSEDVKIRESNGAAYNDLGNWYNSSASVATKYVKITIPFANTWSLNMMELTIRQYHSTPNYGKVLLHFNRSGAAAFSSCKAYIYGELNLDTLKIYADASSLYIKGMNAYANISVDKLLVNDAQRVADLRAVVFEVADTLPSTAIEFTYTTPATDISGKEDKINKVAAWSTTVTDVHYPSEKLVKDSLDGKINTSSTVQQFIISSGTDTPLSLKGNNTSSAYLQFRASDNTHLGDIGVNNQHKPQFYYNGSQTAISLEGHTHSDYVRYSNTGSQIIQSTSDNIPLILHGGTTGEAGIGFKLSTGTVVGYLGVKSDKKPFFMDTDTFSRKEISLVGHTHAAADVTSGEFDLARIPAIPSTKTSGFATVATSGSYNDLSDKPTIPVAQIQSDWNQSTTTALDYIKNKPSTMPPSAHSHLGSEIAGAVEESVHAYSADTATVAYSVDWSGIVSKPSTFPPSSHSHSSADITSGTFDLARIPTIPSTKTSGFADVATSGSYNDLSDKPTIPAAQIQSDWNQSTTTSLDYIKNKPTSLSQFTDDLGSSPTHTHSQYATSTRVTAIEGKIPAAATTTNQLADKDFVNSSIASQTGTFRGTHDTIDAIMSLTNVNNNDYAFWAWTDGQNSEYRRYKALSTSAASGKYFFFNSSLGTLSAQTFSANLSSGGETYNGIRVTATAVDYYWVESGTTYYTNIYASGTWTDQIYRDVAFETAPTGTLLTWLQARSTSTRWAFEYKLNNSSFTAAQWNAINSGVTSGKVSGYDTHVSSTSNPHSVTASQVGAYTTTQTDTLLSGKAASSHNHAASNITSGTFNLARIPTIPSTKTSGFATVATSGSYNDLSNKPTIPAAQIQSDWNQSTTTALDYIKNKPSSFPPSAHSHLGSEIAGAVEESVHAYSADTATVAYTVDWSDISSKPSTFPPSAHTHSGSDITSGTVAFARLPGVTSWQATPDNAHIPSEKLVRDSIDGCVSILSDETQSITSTDTDTPLNLYGGDTTRSFLAFSNSSGNIMGSLGIANISGVGIQPAYKSANETITALSLADHKHSGADITSGTVGIARLPKVTSWSTTVSDSYVPTEKLVKNSIDAKYTKPNNGIPKSDLDSSVQASLGKADTALQSETYKGTVTSVRVQATSPVVSSQNTAQTGTLNTTISLADGYGDTKNPYASKTANYVLAAPNGSAGVPSFRALVANDLPGHYHAASEINSGTLSISRLPAVTTWQATPDNNHIPSEKLVKDSLDGCISIQSEQPQVITSTDTDTPLELRGSDTTKSFLAFSNSSGNTIGFLGIANFSSGGIQPAYKTPNDTITAISLVGHTHAASEITSGTFDINRIPGLTADKITSGTFSTSRIPSLDASKITSGTFATARIPTNISITGNAATATRATTADDATEGSTLATTLENKANFNGYYPDMWVGDADRANRADQADFADDAAEGSTLATTLENKADTAGAYPLMVVGAADYAYGVDWSTVDNKTSVEVSFTSGGTTYTYHLVTE